MNKISRFGRHSWLTSIADACFVLARETRCLLRFDLTSGVITVVFLALFVPTLGRYAENAPMLASFSDDEPLITMQVDGMTAKPYGNPANYLDTYLIKKQVPDYWHNLRYTNIPYYGGLYPGIALAIWVPLKLMGFSLFPTVPIILRALALLFSVCTLLALYNFCRDHLGRFAALVGIISLASEYHFVYIGTMVHPDSLLFFLGFLGLAVCLRHARDGGGGSLVAIGIVAGLAQSAKMGGPWLIPLTVLSIIFGLRYTAHPGESAAKWLRLLTYKGVGVAVVAIAVFLATTPYAILDRYYFETWQIWAKAFTGGAAATQSGFLDWVEAFANDRGAGVLGACAVALLIRLAFWRRFGDPLALLMYMVLALTVFFWYAGLQKYWVQLQYLVLPMIFVAVMAGHLLDIVLAPLLDRSSHRLASAMAGLAVTLALLAFFQGKIFGTLLVPVRYAEWRFSPQLLPGAWIEEHRPAVEGKVLFDSQAYFNPSQFPDQFMNGGPIKYTDLARMLPAYFTLTLYYPNNWMSQKMITQNLSRWDNDYFSMRLYQDLLGRDPANLRLEDYRKHSSEPVPGVTRLVSFGTTSPLNDLTCIPANTSVLSLAKWRCVARILCRACGYTGINMTREVVLFSLDASRFLSNVPENVRYLSALPFASSFVPGFAPSAIQDDNAQAWLSAKNGAAAVGEFIGIDFGSQPIEPKQLTIKWVAYSWLPRSIVVEYSDDGQTWKNAGLLEVRQPIDSATRMAPGTKRWEEEFDLPVHGAHRYWRVVAHDVPDGHFFGMERLHFGVSARE